MLSPLVCRTRVFRRTFCALSSFVLFVLLQRLSPNWAGNSWENTDSSALFGARVRAKLKLHVLWIGGDPSLKESAFLYYQGFPDALHAHESVHVCAHFEACRDSISGDLNATSSVLILAIPHAIASKMSKLAHVESAFTSALRKSSDLSTELRSTARYLTVGSAFFINKVYINLDEKINWFKRTCASDLGSYDNSIIFTWSPHAPEWQEKYSVRFVHIPFAVAKEKFDVAKTCDRSHRDCDLFLHWDTNPNKYSILRSEISQTLGSTASFHMHDKNTSALYNISEPTHFLSHDEYVRTLQVCKVHVSTIGMPGRFDLVGTRYFEVMASGCALLFVERPNESTFVRAYSNLGIIEDENVVMFSSLSEFMRKLAYYKYHTEDSAKITARAYVWADENTWAHRADLVVRSLSQLVN